MEGKLTWYPSLSLFYRQELLYITSNHEQAVEDRGRKREKYVHKSYLAL